jgi:Zn-dependent protease with chaperone function
MDAPTGFALPPRVRFPGLSSAAFEHPSDRAALEALRRTPGLDRLLKWLSDVGAERFVRIMFTADSLRISPRQCSRLYNDLREACAILDAPEPDFYLMQYPYPNAFAFGMQRYTIVITSGLVDMMTDSERLSVIAHELGHIKAEHMLYRTMAILLAELMHEAVGGMALPGAILTGALAYALFAWFRRSEFTCDRAGLLAVQDPEVCVSSLLKLAGGTQRLVDDLNTDEFLRQADLYEDMDEDFLSLYYKFVMVRWQTHPFLAVRAREVKEWSESEQYARLLRGDYPRTNTEAGRRTCSACSAPITNVTYQFCPECGKPLDPPPAAASQD